MKRKTPAILTVLSLSLALLATGCGMGDTAPEQQAASGRIRLTVNDSPTMIDASGTGVWYDVNMLTTEAETEIQVGEFTGYDLTIDGRPAQGGETLYLRLDKLHKDHGIEVSLTNTRTGEVSENYLRTLPVTFPDMIVSGESDGFFYTAVKDYMFKMNGGGSIVFYKHAPGAHDFKRTEIDGKARYSYAMDQTHWDNPYPSGAYTFYSKHVVLDEGYNIIDIVPYMMESDAVPANYPLDMHDFTILDDGHYLVGGYIPKRVTNIPGDVPHSAFGARVIASVLQEIKDGRLVWEWDSTDHPELYAYSSVNNDYYNERFQWSDYIHWNSTTVDPRDDHIVCSFRNVDAIMKIHRTTGNILWILGGKGDQFGLSSDQKFSKQHFARFTGNGALTLFDNATVDDEAQGATGLSRAIELVLDEENRTVLQFRDYAVDRQYSSYMASAQRVDGDKDVFLMGWGGRDTPNALFSEVDFTGSRIIFELIYPADDPGNHTYRAYKSNA